MTEKPDSFSNRLIDAWFQPEASRLTLLETIILALLEQVYRLLWLLRQGWHASLSRPRHAKGIRVIAVGNLLVGGAGKTPCVLALAEAMTLASLKCAVITRGYRSAAEHAAPRVIEPADLANVSAQDIGDETWLLAWRSQLPVAAGKNRWACLLALRKAHPDLDVVILDDGLQQRSLACDERLLVVDERGFGNGHLLPRGPLREPIGNLSRFTGWIGHGVSGKKPSGWARDIESSLPSLYGSLTQTDSLWVNVAQWRAPEHWLAFMDGSRRLKGQRILAVAGIAVPQRFFRLLEDAGITFDALALADHDPETVPRVQAAWASEKYDAILMTEKDAVKFFGLPLALCEHAWALRRDAHLSEDFLKRLIDGSKTS